ncbi:nuclear body protein SP140-like protein [Microcebus murinus]|uniref:nuclear body protein SP140-like protein n=1 Tax=Microcebus murinus TaxID=30608 RepID=UPI003F6C61F9
MPAEDQNIEDRLNYDGIFRHFKKLKVKISRAIKKTFPFLQLLRDHEFITNQMFEDCETSCKNLIPINNVVYNVLEELEKNFNLEVLNILFSDDNIKEYPALIPIFESFKSVLPDEWRLQESPEEEREEGPSSQLSLEQGTGENSFPSLPGPHSDSSFSTGTALPESGLCETEQANTRRTDTNRDKNDALGHQQANQPCAQKPGPAERKTAIPGTLRRRRSRTGRKRGPRIPKDESMNFQLPELPVTCGDIKGILYKEKFQQGTSVKCIKSETRRWFTPRQFQSRGGYNESCNWKLSIRCGGFTLKELIKKGYLPNPPRGRKK